MAPTRSFLLIPVTLCFVLVLAAAAEQQDKATTTLLVIHGKALCKSNSSRIISILAHADAPLQLVINNATVPGGTGRTTSDGQFLITVNLNSTEQLAALMSNGGSSSSSKAFVVAPPHACGAPSLPAGTVVAAEVQPIAMMIIIAGSVQRPTIAAAGTLLVPAVNGSLHATANKGDAVHLVVAEAEQFACLLTGGLLLLGSLHGY